MAAADDPEDRRQRLLSNGKPALLERWTPPPHQAILVQHSGKGEFPATPDRLSGFFAGLSAQTQGDKALRCSSASRGS
jgi:hypothetical protein